MSGFRWRSWLGASVILFLLYGAAVITSMYAAQGATVGGGIEGLAPFYIWPMVALSLGLVALRRLRPNSPG